MNVTQAFRILELPATASSKEVKQTFKRLAKQHHPDVSNYDSTAKFQKINEAYEIAYAFAIKNNNVSKPHPPVKTAVKQPVKTNTSKNAAAYTRATKSPSKKSNTSSTGVGWIIIGVVAFLLLCLMVPGLQLIILILILYAVTRIL